INHNWYNYRFVLLDDMSRSFANRLKRFGRALRKSNYPTGINRFFDVFGIVRVYLFFLSNILAFCSPSAFNSNSSCITQYLWQKPGLHSFLCRNEIDIQLRMPDIQNVIQVIFTTFQTGIEYMKHRHHICKISLMIGNKQYFFAGQISDNLRAFDNQFIKPSIATVRHNTKPSYQLFFEE